MTDLKQKFDASTVAIMRQALNEVVSDHRFSMRESVTPLEVAEHILEQAASGVCDLDRLKSSAFEKLVADALLHSVQDGVVSVIAASSRGGTNSRT